MHQVSHGLLLDCADFDGGAVCLDACVMGMERLANKMEVAVIAKTVLKVTSSVGNIATRVRLVW